MPRYSDSSMLAWNIAAHEAAHGGYSMIEPAHLFIGLAKLVEYPVDELIRQAAPEDSNFLQQMKVEIEQLALVFNRTGIDAKEFRRRLRAELGGAVTPTRKPIMHRSQASRRVFEVAEAFCVERSLHTVEPVHFVWALSTTDGGPWEQVLRELGIDQKSLNANAQTLRN